jgi:hypothetical protein
MIDWVSMKRAFSNKTARALGMFVALLLVPYVVPPLARYRVPIPVVLTRTLHIRTSESGEANRCPICERR